jgi:hypothetical protein
MRTHALFRLNFNPFNLALKPDEKALVRLEIRFSDHGRMYLNIGTYIHSENWDKDRQCIINRPDAGVLNKQLHDLISHIQAYELKLNEVGYPLTKEALKEYLVKGRDIQYLFNGSREK